MSEVGGWKVSLRSNLLFNKRPRNRFVTLQKAFLNTKPYLCVYIYTRVCVCVCRWRELEIPYLQTRTAANMREMTMMMDDTTMMLTL